MCGVIRRIRCCSGGDLWVRDDTVLLPSKGPSLLQSSSELACSQLWEGIMQVLGVLGVGNSDCGGPTAA